MTFSVASQIQNTEPIDSGIPVVGSVPWGTHFCQFYQTKQDLVDVLVPYFRAGLERNEYCMWITSEPLHVAEAHAVLREAMPELDVCIARGQIEILDYSEWYTAGGHFESDRVLRGWVEREQAALQRGFEGLRLTGNTFWLQKSDWQSFSDYEAVINDTLGEHRILALCTYSIERCGAYELIDVVRNHQFALIKQQGRWEAIESLRHKKTEAALREVSEQRGLALEAANLGWWHYNPISGQVYWDDRFKGIFGVTEDRLGYHRVISLIHSDDRTRVDCAVSRALDPAVAIPYDIEYRVVWPDGSIHWIAAKGKAFFEGAGKERRAVRFVGTVMDISARKQAEEEIRRRKELLAVTLASIGDGVVVTDVAGRVTFLNAEAEKLTGWRNAEAAGQPLPSVFRIVDEATRRPAENPVERVLRCGTVIGLANHTILLARDGREVPIDDSGAPIRSADGSIQGVVLVFRDCSEQKAARLALEESERRVRHKLDSILSPEGDIGNLELGDIIDVPAVQSLMNDYYELVRVPMAIIDLQGKVLVGVGWQDICTKFHRAHPETHRHCIESDTQLSAGVCPGEFRLYRCKNNMWDLATPIMVGGKHLGNLFTGQFFFEDESPDHGLFRAQASRYGFDEGEYITALDRVPRLSRAAVNRGMSFLVKFAEMLALLSYSNIKLARSSEALQRSRQELYAANEELSANNEELQAAEEELTSQNENLLHVQTALTQTRELLEAVLDNTHVLVACLDEDFNFLLVNSAYARADGRTPDFFPGRNHFELYPNPENEAIFRRVRETGEPYFVTGKPFVYANDPGRGTSYWDWSLIPICDADGVVRRLVMTLTDVSERTRMEAALREAKDAAEAANTAKDHFLAVLSHELRNPLQPALLTASALEDDGELPAAVRADISIIRRNLDLEVKLIDDLLDMTRIARGKLEVKRRVVDAHSLLLHALHICRPDALVKRIELGTSLRAQNMHVSADGGRLQQVFWNLIKNAVKFTPDGGRIELRSSNPDPHLLRITVADNGQGIDPVVLPRLFRPFEQGSRLVTQQFGGLGLGLAISKAVVEMHGGTITAESAGKGRGTTFSIDLPVIVAEPQVEEPGPSFSAEQESRGLRILLVEDNTESARVVAKFLNRWGHRVQIAEGMSSGLNHARSDSIDLLISDLGLPDGSGLDLMREIRKSRPDLKGIALSGYGMESDLRRSREAGFAEHLTKPVDIKMLQAAIERVAGGR